MKAFVILSNRKYSELEDRGFVLDSEQEIESYVGVLLLDTKYGRICDEYGYAHTPFPVYLYEDIDNIIKPHEVIDNLETWIKISGYTSPFKLLELEINRGELVDDPLGHGLKGVLFCEKIKQEHVQAVYDISVFDTITNIKMELRDEHAEDIFLYGDISYPTVIGMYPSDFYSVGGWYTFRLDCTIERNLECMNDKYKEELINRLKTLGFKWSDIKYKTPNDLGL